MPKAAPRLRPDDFDPNNKKIVANVVGPRVKMRREALGLTQDQLNAKISSSTNGRWNPASQEILQIERRRRMVIDTELLALAHCLEVSLIWLLTGHE